VKEGQRYINLNPGRIFVQQPPQMERGREALLNLFTMETHKQNTEARPVPRRDID